MDCSDKAHLSVALRVKHSIYLYSLSKFCLMENRYSYVYGSVGEVIVVIVVTTAPASGE